MVKAHNIPLFLIDDNDKQCGCGSYWCSLILPVTLGWWLLIGHIKMIVQFDCSSELRCLSPMIVSCMSFIFKRISHLIHLIRMRMSDHLTAWNKLSLLWLIWWLTDMLPNPSSHLSIRPNPRKHIPEPPKFLVPPNLHVQHEMTSTIEITNFIHGMSMFGCDYLRWWMNMQVGGSGPWLYRTIYLQSTSRWWIIVNTKMSFIIQPTVRNVGNL